MIGTKLAHYEITSHLGSGGMGDVYQATDSKLGRSVAIKLLPEVFTHDPERAARFDREARVLASLNHSNIAAIYGIEQSGDRKFLVMELVGGDTLAERIKRGPIPIDESLQIAKQICEALEAAHEKGIIHRDLKPGNVKILPDGKVKVLDFGLAKAFDDQTARPNVSNSPTLSMAATSAGVVLGTAAYMSPEQAKGREVDQRTDVFAFGCVLYEMLTGRGAFEGEDVAEILSRVLQREPDWTALPETTPSSIRSLLKRCLQKDRSRRLRHTADARFQIEDALSEPAVVAAPSRSTRERLAWVVAALVTAAIVATAIAASVLYFIRPVQGREIRVQVIAPPTDDPIALAISPDGQWLVFVVSAEGKTQLWIRALEYVTAQPVPGTEGATYPFWSPDSRSLGFFADGKLKRIEIAGGPARVLANAPSGRGGTWNRDDVIVFGPSGAGPLYRVSATGGSETVPVTKIELPRHTGHRFPDFLPDGRHFVFNSIGTVEGHGVYLASLDSPQVQKLCDSDSQAVYVPAGYLLFVREGILLAQRFDLSTFRLTGEPISVAERVNSDSAISVAAFGFAGGILAYRAGTAASARQLVWLDRSGKSVGVVGGPDTNIPFNPSISPDGQRVALDRQVNGNVDVWLLETTRVATRFTVDASNDRGPVWSPDGTRIVFASQRNGFQDLYEKSVSGGTERLLMSSTNLSSTNARLALDWSSDGRFVLYREVDPNSGYDLWAMPMSGDRKPFPIANTPFEERDGQFSPDGRWVAYRSNESGRFEVYVQPFPGPGDKSLVSTNGGTQPRWGHDGKELFYLSPDSKLIAIPITLSADGKTMKAGSPASLFSTRIAGGPTPGTQNQQYAVAPDGRRFLVNVATDEASTPITLILNWNPQVKR